MELVKVDQKWRIQIPKKFRKRLKIKPRHSLSVQMSDEQLILGKPKGITEKTDPVLRDMVKRPLRSKMKVTDELLKELKDEAWTA